MGSEWNRILVPIQFSKKLPAAELQLAREVARTHEATIVLLHVVPVSPAVAADAGLAAQYYVEAEEDARSRLRKMAESRLKGFKTEIDVEVGEPANIIVKQAVKLRADLVIMATHGREGLKRLLLGSVAEHVVRNCPCPTLTVRPGS